MSDIVHWRKAGRIAAEALEYGKSLIKNGAVIREVCDKIDKKIIALGARPAWPSQVSLDIVAAHYTPDPDDMQTFDNNLVCLDVGAHVDGFIGDNALSVDLSGKYENVVSAARDALAAVEALVAPGVQLGEIGKVIESAMIPHGCVPVRNLSGHGIRQWVIHAPPSVPNYNNRSSSALTPGLVFASEPFATNGMGMIYEADSANLFSLKARRPVRSPLAREVLSFVEEQYGSLVFTTRWISEQFGKGKATLALRELVKANILHAYPPLIEKKGVVAQFEKTFYVHEDRVEVLTTTK